jgi:hypothetical protein
MAMKKATFGIPNTPPSQTQSIPGLACIGEALVTLASWVIDALWGVGLAEGLLLSRRAGEYNATKFR